MLMDKDCLPALNNLANSQSTYVQANIAWVFGNLAQHGGCSLDLLNGDTG